MLRRLSIAAGLVAAISAAPVLAAGTAAGGLQAMKDYNLIVLGNMTGTDDVEGKALVGGQLSGNVVIGIGNGTQGQASSSAPSLTAGSINNANININNGSNGGSGTVSTGSGIAVVGNVTNTTVNMNASTRTWRIGGDYSSKAEVTTAGDDLMIGGSIFGALEQSSGTSALLGGTKSGGGNYNGGVFTQNITASQPTFASSIATPIANTISQVSDDVKALSTALAGLTLASNPSTASFVSTALTLNAVDGGNGFAVFNLDAADFVGLTAMTYNFPTTTLPVIVNVTGTNVVLPFNSAGTNKASNQQVIWNFVNATLVDFTGNIFHGSVLAPYAHLKNHTPIEGSVVAGSFQQGGEVHLGTYNLGQPTPPVTPPVPEPATWAMMIAGMGLVGAGMRRQARGKALLPA